MLCPCCKAPLEESGLERLETIEEHVCDPNGIPSMKMGYRCSDATCLTRKHNVIWNEGGERYGGLSDNNELLDEKSFIDGNDSPFGTLSRKLNVEIYKKGLPSRKELFIIGDIKFLLEFEYNADENGNVLRKRWRLSKWKRDRGGWISYEFPIVSFWRGVKDGWKGGMRMTMRRAELREKGYDISKFKMNGIDKINFQLPNWDKRWWRVWSVKMNRWMFKHLVNDIPLRG